jgi:hypothetical protein
MFNEKIANYLIEIEEDLKHLVECNHPDNQTLSGTALYIQLKDLQNKFYKLNSAIFLAAPKELESEILKAKKVQNHE